MYKKTVKDYSTFNNDFIDLIDAYLNDKNTPEYYRTRHIVYLVFGEYVKWNPHFKEREFFEWLASLQDLADNTISAYIEALKKFFIWLGKDFHIGYSLQRGMTELKKLKNRLNFPEHIMESSYCLYKKALKKNLLRGRAIKEMVVACLYYACKQDAYPITLQEILDEVSINGNIVKNCIKILWSELDLKTLYIDPVSLIPKYCASLGLYNNIEKEVIKILKHFIKNKSTSGKDPKGLCGGAIYYVTNIRKLNITQFEISNIVGISDVTLRARYKEILQYYRFNFRSME